MIEILGTTDNVYRPRYRRQIGGYCKTGILDQDCYLSRVLERPSRTRVVVFAAANTALLRPGKVPRFTLVLSAAETRTHWLYSRTLALSALQRAHRKASRGIALR